MLPSRRIARVVENRTIQRQRLEWPSRASEPPGFREETVLAAAYRIVKRGTGSNLVPSAEPSPRPNDGPTPEARQHGHINSQVCGAIGIR